MTVLPKAALRRFVRLLSLCVPLSGCGSRANGDELHVPARQAILNGTPATMDELLSTVALVDGGGFQHCTGVLVSPQVVLTAAHCVVLQDGASGRIVADLGPQHLQVVAGGLDSENPLASQLYSIDDIRRHPEFTGGDHAQAQDAPVQDGPSYEGPGDVVEHGGQRADIALVLLEREVTTLAPAETSSMEVLSRLSVDDPLVIAGYGARTLDGRTSGELIVAETPFRRTFGGEFLAGASGHPDTCPGDSGGPAYFPEDLSVLGIASRGVSSDRICGDGGIYTLVPAYTAWIDEVTLEWEHRLSAPPREAWGCNLSRTPARGRLCGSYAAAAALLLAFGTRRLRAA